jgi:large subunit ribosomal protein L18
MANQSHLQVRKMQRMARTRKAVKSQGGRPRLSVFRSNRSISAQLIDDVKMHTIAAVSSATLEKGKRTKSDAATMVGEAIGKKAKDLGIAEVVFDRGSYRYHGRVKALAEGARKAGLIF